MRTQFLALLISALPALAGVISSPTAGIFDGFTNAGVTGSFSGQPHAVISGTACYDGFCPGQAVPGAGPDYNVADPLTMKLTSFQAQCPPTASACGGYVDAYFSFYATANAQYAASFSIDGQGSGNQSLLYGGFLLNQTTSAMLFGNQTISLPPVNSSSVPAPLATINDSFSLGTINVNAGDQIFARISLLVELRLGQTVLLPDSLTLTLADTASVPEPATLGLMAAALAALVIGRKATHRI